MKKMPLAEMLDTLLVKGVEGGVEGDVTGLAYHSARVQPGYLFFSLSGRQGEGWQYAREALNHGAMAVVVDLDCPVEGIPLIRVSDVRLALALLANRFYGNPSGQFRLIGVTGTNGKTSTTHMIDWILRDQGEVTGLLGTVGYRIGGDTLTPLATTPEANDLQELLSRLAGEGASHVTMEVSSHALEQQRVAGCQFDVAVLTNITGEHLDFHQTFEAYRDAKTKFFAWLGWSEVKSARTPVAVLNADDPCFDYVNRWGCGQKITYGITNPADVRADQIKYGADGLSFQVNTFSGSSEARLPLKGLFNVYNALAAVSTGLVEGLALAEICESLSRFPGVPGRFETVDAGQEYTVVVDYAHTPDGLENVIKTARNITTGRIITVFGCGGERDRSKRALMGEMAGRFSDLAIVTDDNPRGEDPLQIIQEVLPGLQRYRPAEGYRIISDRRKAISTALDEAGSGDLVLIAGKGHEAEQIYHDRVIPFSDRSVARELILAKLRGR
jgi:UDP-N-acetylmuramoyl-L-alanyl-D-glutamate--2,6-diaminopimelate ligase